MPPSTSSSTTRSASLSPTCGELEVLLSILVTRIGCFCAALSPSATSSPVSGHVSGVTSSSSASAGVKGSLGSACWAVVPRRRHRRRR